MEADLAWETLLDRGKIGHEPTSLAAEIIALATSGPTPKSRLRELDARADVQDGAGLHLT